MVIVLVQTPTTALLLIQLAYLYLGKDGQTRVNIRRVIQLCIVINQFYADSQYSCAPSS